MKKYILLSLLMFSMLFAPKVHAADVYGFMDGKFYDVNAVLKYQCFMDGNCYDLDMKPAPFKLVPINAPIVTPVVDVCANIEGVQSVIPVGLVNNNGNCVAVTPSLATTIDTEKITRVKDEITACVGRLRDSITTLGYTPINGVTWFRDGIPHSLTVNDVNTDPEFYTYKQVRVVLDTNKQISDLRSKIQELNTISFEVQDYGNTGAIPSAASRAYLQSNGINW